MRTQAALPPVVPPPRDTKLISASQTDSWHFHHPVCRGVCGCAQLEPPDTTVTVGQVPTLELPARPECSALHRPVAPTATHTAWLTVLLEPPPMSPAEAHGLFSCPLLPLLLACNTVQILSTAYWFFSGMCTFFE